MNSVLSQRLMCIAYSHLGISFLSIVWSSEVIRIFEVEIYVAVPGRNRRLFRFVITEKIAFENWTWVFSSLQHVS